MFAAIHAVESLVVVIILLIVGWSFHRAWKRRPKNEQPRCARCQYLLVAMASNRCPECGADPFDVGIIPAARARFDRRKLPLWTLAMFLVAFLACVFLDVTIITYTWDNKNQNMQFKVPGHEFNAAAIYRVQGWSFLPPAKLFRGAVSYDTRPSTTVEYDFAHHLWTLTPASGPKRSATTLSPADFQACIPGLDGDVADTFHEFFDKGLSTGPNTYVGVSHPNAIGGGNGGGLSGSNPYYLSTGHFIPWLCILIWGLGIRWIPIWEFSELRGSQAQAHLRQFARPGANEPKTQIPVPQEVAPSA